MTDDTAVMLAAGRVRRGNVVGALQLIVRQAADCGCLSRLDKLDGLTCPHSLVDCPVCGGAGELTECANDGTHGCSHTYDRVWKCTTCRGEGEVSPAVAAAAVAGSDVEW